MSSYLFVHTYCIDVNMGACQFGHYRDFEVQHNFLPDASCSNVHAEDPGHYGIRSDCWTILCKRREADQPGHSYAILKRLPDELVTISQRITSHQHSLLAGRSGGGHAHSVTWKERHFLHSGHVTIVAYNIQGSLATAILRIREDLVVPAFLTVSHDVTGDPAYFPYSLPDVVP